MHADLLVVGGGPAGLAAARGYRDQGGAGAVLVVSADTAPPYDRPPLSKDYLRGEADERDLPMAEPGEYAERGIELRQACAVTGLDAAARTAVLDTGERLSFAACVLATGSAPTALPVPTAGDAHPAYLRSLDDARALRSSAEGASSAVVVGSGFIGCEAAASLARRGLAVTVVSMEPLPQQARLGADVGERIAGWLRAEGVTLIGGVEVAALDAGEVRLVDRPPVRADLLLVAAGATPVTDLAEKAGALVEDGLVVVDEGMRTSLPGVYAAGDIALARNGAAGRRLKVEHWGEAMAMGEIAGANAGGGDRGWAQAPGFWSTIGDHTLKYSAWGDGYDDARFVDHGGGAFTVWYETDGVVVGVATHEADDDYDRGQRLVEESGHL
jgi:3-phenylpropionate/trans-cinnamate dioxygenase ferredoxin reductase subunit